MGDLSSIFPNELVLGAIWFKLCQVTPWKEKYKLFHSLHLSNKPWKHVVDHSQEWLHSMLQICIIHSNRLIVKEHNRMNKVVTKTTKKEQQRTNVAIASLEKEQHMTY
jgi:hypothetical protein